MININKNIIIFAGIILLLGTSSLVFLKKLSPLLSHVTYYCQTFISSLSLPIPYYLSAIPFLLFFTFLLMATIKLIIICVEVQLLRKKLTKNFKTSIQFNTILGNLQLTDKTYLVESNKRFAFCLGIRNPKIYLSTALLSILSTQEIEAVLLHERYHLYNRDTFTMLTASIGESLLPFFPLLSDFLHNYRIEREIEADKEAVRGLGNSYLLVSVLKKLLTTPSLAIVTVSAIADEDTLESRIKALVKKDYRFKEFKAKHIIISLVSAFIIIIIMLAPVQAIEIHHMGEDVVMICPHESLCTNECKQEYSTNRKDYSENTIYTPIR